MKRSASNHPSRMNMLFTGRKRVTSQRSVTHKKANFKFSDKEHLEVKSKQTQIILQSLLIIGLVFSYIGCQVVYMYGVQLGIPIDWGNISTQAIGFNTVILAFLLGLNIYFPYAFLSDGNTIEFIKNTSFKLVATVYYLLPVGFGLASIIFAWVVAANFAEEIVVSTGFILLAVCAILLLFHILIPWIAIYKDIKTHIFIGFKFVILFLFTFFSYAPLLLMYPIVSGMKITSDSDAIILTVVMYVINSSLVLSSISDIRDQNNYFSSKGFYLALMILFIVLFPLGPFTGRAVISISKQGGGVIREFYISNQYINKIPSKKRSALGIVPTQNGDLALINLCLWYTGTSQLFVSKPDKEDKYNCDMPQNLKYLKGIYTLDKDSLQSY